jgi:aminoglycoside phosphotransferase (APT) family kinase protein
VTGSTSASAATDHTPQLDLHALGAYLENFVGPAASGSLAATLIAGGRSNPTYAITDGERHWVLRHPPCGEYVKSGHDMGREVTAMIALQDSKVPVPNVVAFCEDTRVLGVPFYVMDRVDGRTYRTQVDTATLTEAHRAQLASGLVSTLADLHAIDPADVGLQDWGRPDGYLSRQLSRWGRQWTAVATTENPQVAELISRLGASLPITARTGIVHGDFKIDNLMFEKLDPSRILAVLDWEMSTLGDTMADVGLLISFWDEPGELHNPITKGATALPGFPRADDIVNLYAQRLGGDIDHLDWYVVFSDLKIAVILEQIHRRHLAGTTTGDGFDDIGQMVGPLLERALERSSRSNDSALRGAGV